MKWKKLVTYLLVVGLIAIGTSLLFHFTVPKAQPLLTPVDKLAANDSKKSAIEYLALGDSLTEGVGDETAHPFQRLSVPQRSNKLLISSISQVFKLLCNLCYFNKILIKFLVAILQT